MQEKTLKLALAHNALEIANMEAHLGAMRDRAEYFKQEGEMAFHYHECDKITKLRAKKVKAIAHQTWMKRELKGARQRDGSILSLKVSGIDLSHYAADFTSFELEAMASVAKTARRGARTIERMTAFLAKKQAEAVPLAA